MAIHSRGNGLVNIPVPWSIWDIEFQKSSPSGFHMGQNKNKSEEFFFGDL